MSKSVSGLFDVTAKTPMPPNARMPDHASVFVKTGRVTEVSSTDNVNAVMLAANAHEMPSALKRMGVENKLSGCQAGRVNSNGICTSQMNILRKASAAPIEAASQAKRAFGCKTRKTTNASAVIKSKRQVTKINMGEHNCISIITAAFAPDGFGTIPAMIYGHSRLNRRGPALWLLTFLLAVSCAAPVPASNPNPTPDSLLPNYLPTPTPFQPQPQTSPDPYLAFATPQIVPTFTPYPTKYVLPQDISVPVDISPAIGGVALYNPLTGLPVDDPTFMQRRPLAIKIANSPDYIRPQSSLTLADVVYEYYIEWGDTRFVGIFWSNADKAERVGPVRSGRYFDEHLVRMYHAFLFFKGADPRELDYFNSLEIAQRFVTVGFGNCPPYFMGPYKRDSYNNVFFNATKWQACVERRGYDNIPSTISGGFFSESIPQSPLTVSKIYSFYSTYNYNYWEYDPDKHVYVRYQESKDLVGFRKVEVYEPLYDDYARQPVTTENVVVLLVPYIFNNQNQAEDEVYNPSLIDYGYAYVFRDGIAIPAMWNRASIDQPILLTHLDGSPIYLRPGQTFYQVMGVTSKQIQNGADWRFEFATP